VVLISALGFGLAWLLARDWGVEGVAAGMTLTELACAAWCVWILHRVMLPRGVWA
jgi:Na+-driven multidrug efflux pump